MYVKTSSKRKFSLLGECARMVHSNAVNEVDRYGRQAYRSLWLVGWALR